MHANGSSVHPENGVARTSVAPTRRSLSDRERTDAALLRGLHQVQGVCTFELDGTLIEGNAKFAAIFGYTPDVLPGLHHDTLVPKDVLETEAHLELWPALRQGEVRSGTFRRCAKGAAREVWIHGDYVPLVDEDGEVYGVGLLCGDITSYVVRNADHEGQIAAIQSSQAVISFEMDGTIREANENFLQTLGYTAAEIQGQHHSIFVRPEERSAPEYRALWQALRRGEAQTGSFRRIGKDGREVWIQGSYTPIRNLAGKPFKVVKYASDITERVQRRRALEAGVEEILAVVAAASKGDLTRELQLRTDQPEGRLADALRSLLSDFRGSIREIAQASEAVAAAATQVASVSRQMAVNAADTSEHAISSSAAAEQVDANVKTIATSVDEMNESITEVAAGAGQAAEVAMAAVTMARETDENMRSLRDSSASIDAIVKVVTSITQQTNLLALNATIEAARAGEAGKGFAVVASEVKELAKQTAAATEDISRKVADIQSKTKVALGSIDQIKSTIDVINETQTTIASAMEEQTATTSEIARSLTEASSGTTEISSGVATVARAASDTAQGANDVQSAGDELSRIANELQRTVSAFRY